MELARETLINAQGWSKFQEADNKKSNQEHLDFAHFVAKTFSTKEGKKVLDAMVNKYLLCSIVQPNDTQFSAGIKEGRASVVRQILSQIEISNNTK